MQVKALNETLVYTSLNTITYFIRGRSIRATLNPFDMHIVVIS